MLQLHFFIYYIADTSLTKYFELSDTHVVQYITYTDSRRCKSFQSRCKIAGSLQRRFENSLQKSHKNRQFVRALLHFVSYDTSFLTIQSNSVFVLVSTIASVNGQTTVHVITHFSSFLSLIQRT